MSDAIFDGVNLTIQLPAIGDFDVQRDLYSAWKRWVALSDNAKFVPAFATVGGDEISVGQQVAPYFFCRNDLGWRIKMPDADGEIILSGNLFPRDSTQGLYEQSPGFDAFLRLDVSSKAIVVDGGGTGDCGLTPEQEAILNLIPGLY